MKGIKKEKQIDVIRFALWNLFWALFVQTK